MWINEYYDIDIAYYYKFINNFRFNFRDVHIFVGKKDDQKGITVDKP